MMYEKKWEKVEAVCSSVDFNLGRCISLSLYHEIFKRWEAIGFRMPGEPEHAPSHWKKVAMIDLTKPLSANNRSISSNLAGTFPIRN